MHSYIALIVFMLVVVNVVKLEQQRRFTESQHLYSH